MKKKKTNWTEIGVFVGLAALVITVFVSIHNSQNAAAQAASAPQVANAKAHGHTKGKRGP